MLRNAGDTVPSGFKLIHLIPTPRGKIKWIAWSPDGLLLASRQANTIGLWEAETGQARQIITIPNDNLWGTVWSPDGQILATGTADGIIRLWDLNTYEQRSMLKANNPNANCISWSPDGRFLASGTNDKAINIWDTKSQQLHRVIKGDFSFVTGLSWSPSGRILAAISSLSKAILLFDTQSWRLFEKIDETLLRDCLEENLGLAWSPDEQTLASAPADSTIRIWKTEAHRQMNILEGHADFINSIAYSYDGKLLASKSHDGTVRVWRCDTYQTSAILTEYTSSRYVSGLAFHPSANILATLGELDEVIRIWELDIKELYNQTPIINTIPYISNDAFSFANTGPSIDRGTKAKSDQSNNFEHLYPNVAAWIAKGGWIEIGQSLYCKSFIRAVNKSAVVWEGKKEYKNIDEALRMLDKGIAEWERHYYQGE